MYVVQFSASTRIRLSRDGFSAPDASFMNTEDETVRCDDCETVYELCQLAEETNNE